MIQQVLTSPAGSKLQFAEPFRESNALTLTRAAASSLRKAVVDAAGAEARSCRIAGFQAAGARTLSRLRPSLAKPTAEAQLALK